MKKVVFTQACEDSHPSIAEDRNGKPRVGYDVRKFREGETLSLPDDRAAKLIKLGVAKAAKG